MRDSNVLLYLQSLIRLVERRGIDTDDATDIVYEAYALFYSYGRKHDIRDEKSLLRRIVINLAINHYHREQKSAEGFVGLFEAIVDPKPGPERILSAEQELMMVTDVLKAVSPHTCRIFLMQRAGYKYDEIASAFAIKPRTVEKHVDRGATVIEEYFGCGTLTTSKMWSKW
jgi:RNA polymerase sigma factor (sigma-70 family)